MVAPTGNCGYHYAFRVRSTLVGATIGRPFPIYPTIPQKEAVTQNDNLFSYFFLNGFVPSILVLRSGPSVVPDVIYGSGKTMKVEGSTLSGFCRTSAGVRDVCSAKTR